MFRILDGKIVRDKIAENLAKRVKKLQVKPCLAIIQVGDNPESNTYIRQKKLFAEKIGAMVIHEVLPFSVSQKDIAGKIRKFNSDKKIHGIIVQIPLPKTLDKDAVIETIDPAKDVDGLTSYNLKLEWVGKRTGIIPATAKGIQTLLQFYKIPVGDKKVVVVGRSALVGKPTALLLLNDNATVTVCHKRTKNLSEETKLADILVVATGHPKLIGKEHVSKNQTIIDVGITSVVDSKTGEKKVVGDVDFEAVKNIVSGISPVPGGVGPMTVASLFENLVDSAEKQ